MLASLSSFLKFPWLHGRLYFKSYCPCFSDNVGRKRFFSNPSPSSCDEPRAKQPRNSDTACQITPECSRNTSTTTPSKAIARRITLQASSPSPSKLSKRPCRVARSPKSPACSSPKSTPASPSLGENCTRRRRGGELSKEFQVT